MKKIIATFRSISKSENVHEMISRTPVSYIDFFAFFPMLLMFLLPVYQLVYTSIFPPNEYFLDSSFGISVNAVSIILIFLGVLFIILKAAKNVQGGIKFGIKQALCDNIPMVFFGFLILMMIVSTCINGFTDAALHGDEYRRENLFTYILYFAGFYFLASKIKTEKFKAILLYTFIFASIPLAVCVYVDFDIVPLNAFMNKLDFLGIFNNSNHYGYYLTMIILVSATLFIKEKNIVLKMLSILSFVINTLILIMNNTFGCYLAVLGGLIFNCIIISKTENKFNKRTLILPVVFLLLTFIMSFRFYTFMSNFTSMFADFGSIIFEKDDALSAGSGRWKLWVTTAKCIAEKPIFGSGVEGVADDLLEITNGGNGRTHNEFLQYAAFFGIPAAIAYICGTFSVFLNGLKNKFRLDMYSIAALTASFGYLFSSVFGNTMYYTSPFFFILLGIGFSVNKTQNNKANA